MRFNKIIEATIQNEYEIHEDSALLVCTTDIIENIDITNDFHFNHDYDIVNITNTIELDSLEDLYRYILSKNIFINTERITTKGLLVGEDANLVIRSNLRLDSLD